MYKFPEFLNVPLEDWIDAFMNWFLSKTGGLFDMLASLLLHFLLYLEKFFLFIPWFVLIPAAGVFIWRLTGKWLVGLMMTVFLLLIGCFGFWEASMTTLALVTGAVIIALVIGIPVGICMAKSRLLEMFLRPVLDVMQTMPSFVYLIPALILFGLGKVPALFATVVYSLPPLIRLTNAGIREVDESLVEASRAFGADEWQVLRMVELPLACRTIIIGINQTTMKALTMVVVASMIGARGLGLEVLLAINRIEFGRGFEAGLSIVFLAVIVDRITNALVSDRKK